MRATEEAIKEWYRVHILEVQYQLHMPKEDLDELERLIRADDRAKLEAGE